MRFLILTLFLLSTAASSVAQEAPEPTIEPLSLVRRLHLRLNDRIPTPLEMQQVIEEADIEALTERLLASPDFRTVRQQIWIGWLGITRREDLAWVQRQLAENTPIDQRLRNWFGYQQLAADDDLAMRLTERIGPHFFGKGFECSRCHDHPYEETTQKEFLQVAGFFRKGGALITPDIMYSTMEKGAPIPARTPKGFDSSASIKFSRRSLEQIASGNVRETDERKGLVEFGDWIGDFRENQAMEQILVAHYQAWLTDDPFLVQQVRESLDGRPLEKISRALSAWRQARYDEVALIRFLVESPEFLRHTHFDSGVRPTKMSASTWERSVVAALSMEKMKKRPKLQGSTFLERANFLDSILESLPATEDARDLNAVWLNTLGRLPTEREIKASQQAEEKDLYWTLFLSDEFSRYP